MPAVELTPEEQVELAKQKGGELARMQQISKVAAARCQACKRASATQREGKEIGCRYSGTILMGRRLLGSLRTTHASYRLNPL